MYSAAYVWAKIVSYMENHLDPIIVSTWFDDAQVVELTEEHLILYTTTELRRGQINRYAVYIHDALKEIFNSDAKVIVYCDDEM